MASCNPSKQVKKKKLNHNYDKEIIIQPQVKFVNCQIRTSLGILGKKWTIPIIRYIGVRKINHFNRILESIPGLTPRPFIVSEGVRKLRRDRMQRNKEIITTTKDGFVKAY